jgi:hypothetical protein
VKHGIRTPLFTGRRYTGIRIGVPLSVADGAA